MTVHSWFTHGIRSGAFMLFTQRWPVSGVLTSFGEVFLSNVLPPLPPPYAINILHPLVCSVIVIVRFCGAWQLIDPRDDQGRTPLHLACANGHFAATKTLLERYERDFTVWCCYKPNTVSFATRLLSLSLSLSHLSSCPSFFARHCTLQTVVIIVVVVVVVLRGADVKALTSSLATPLTLALKVCPSSSSEHMLWRVVLAEL